MYVDDPRSMEQLLQQVFPGAEIKMDVGHLIFSRIGKLLNKSHPRYGECVQQRHISGRVLPPRCLGKCCVALWHAVLCYGVACSAVLWLFRVVL